MQRLHSLARSLSGGKGIKQGQDEVQDNITMFQTFEWYIPADQKHWIRITNLLPELKAIGIDNIWLPPFCKAAHPHGNGYDVYDLYDIGEFDQKGTIPTKWGPKSDLIKLSRKAQEIGIGLFCDVVFNHKAGADYAERCQAVKVDSKDRRKIISKPSDVEVWTGFTFPGRGEKYSSMKYNHKHFSGTDYDALKKEKAIFKFTDKKWAHDVDDENGNYDYLMFADVDFSQLDVQQDLLNWGTWITSELNLSGMRLDAIKHYSQSFQKRFVQHMDYQYGKKFFFVGEYWSTRMLNKQLENFGGRISLFDVQLVYNLSDISQSRQNDLRKVFNNTLVKSNPSHAVTFVANHDTQEFQSLAAPVEEWFVPHAYSFILLRKDGYPCVFYGDLYGTKGPRPKWPSSGGRLARLILARKLYAYGPQTEYSDDHNCIGWTRSGHHSKPDSGLAILLTNSWSYKQKRMYVGENHSGEIWNDIMEWAWGEVRIDSKGFGIFPVGPRSISVWANTKTSNFTTVTSSLLPTNTMYHT